MICMNLLPERQEHFAFIPLQFWAKTVGVLFFAVLVIYFYLGIQKHHLSEIRVKKAAKLQELQRKMGALARQTKEYKIMEQQIAVLGAKRAEQELVMQFLSAVFKSVLSFRISFESVEMADGILQVKGVAFDANTLAAYTKHLSDLFEVQEVGKIETKMYPVGSFRFLWFSCQIFPKKLDKSSKKLQAKEEMK